MKQHEGKLCVFIENEAGSDIKHHYNEETFAVLRTEKVGACYPFPYGFVPGTLAPDGDAADCFLITSKPFRSGASIDCVPVALLEQTEGGDTDHNVLAVLPGDPAPDLDKAQEQISRFIKEFRAGDPGGQGVPGRLLPAAAALEYVAACAAAKGSFGRE